MDSGTASTKPSNMISLLSIMMFLQFFTWGAWFATMSAALDANRLGSVIGAAYGGAPIAAILAPLFLGLVADRFFASEKIMGILMLIGGGLLLVIPGSAFSAGTNGNVLVWLVLFHLLCYMPTLGLSNTIAFTHIPDQNLFPRIRVWGTIGWIAAGLFVGTMGWSSSPKIFYVGAVSSLLLGVFCFGLPHTPPPLRGQPLNWRSMLMLDAFKLLRDWNFFVFAVCSTLVSVPLAYYYGTTAAFLSQTGFAEPAATMTIGQMSEIVFMLLIPFFFRHLGVKWMILVGMGCWVLRYVLFAFGAPQQVTWMLLLAVALHGICYDFFFVTGFMYTDKKAPKEIRGQAQSLLVFLTQGIGMFFGYKLMAGDSISLGRSFTIPLNFTIGRFGQQVDSEPFVEALATARGTTETLGFVETFGKMFTRSLPESIDPELLAGTMEGWKNFWLFPAMMAAAVMVFFALAFWDRMGAEPPQQ